MADLIKKIKIKKQDGTFTDYIPIGAEAQNVSTNDGDSVQLKLNKKPYYYNSIADMKADTKLKVGDMVVTLGYYSANDGGNGEYRIVNGEYIDDSGSYHELNNNLFAELIIKDKINIKQFGAYGDKIHDDTNAFKKGIAFCKENKIKNLIIPAGEFLISQTLSIDFSNIDIIGEKNNKIYWSGLGDTGTFFSIAGTITTPIYNISISNLYLDGTLQVFKGGHSLEDHPELTNPYPAAKGLTGILAGYTVNVRIKNNYLNDIYGTGIRASRSSKVIISENYLTDVGGGDPVHAPSGSGYDDFGDAIVGFECFDCIFSKNTIINKRLYLDGNSGYIGKPCGRSGLEFEYVLNQDNKITPLAADLFTNLSSSYGLIIEDNFVYGFTKGIHIESTANILINKNTVIHNHIGLMDSTNGSCTITNNYFNTDGVGSAPQSGYDGYYGGVAISQYGNLNVRSGDIVSNNIFEGATGVVIGANHVIISENHFRTTSNAIDDEVNSNYLEIIGNHFYNGCSCYHYNSTHIKYVDNIFMPQGHITLEAGGDYYFKNNIIKKQINFNGTAKDVTFDGNTFILSEISEDASETYNLISNYAVNGLRFINNDIYIQNADNVRLWCSTSTGINLEISGNNVDASSSTERANLPLFWFKAQMRRNVNIHNNYIRDNSADFVFIQCSWNCEQNSFSIKNNFLTNANGLIFRQSAGGFIGKTFYEANVGRMVFNANPNRSLDVFKDLYCNKGECLYKWAPTDNNVGYYCYSSGYYITDVWTSGTSYSVGKMVLVNNKVYKNIVAGTASEAPSGTTINTVETTADNLQWMYCGTVAQFKNISVTDIT